MAVSRISIIKPGTLSLDCFEIPRSDVLAMKYLCGIGGGSTVTYLESDARILVDTGFEFESDMSAENTRANRKRLSSALKDAGLSPRDIDILFLTHWHADHTMNRGLFPGCEIVMLRDAIERHELDFTALGPGARIAEGVEVLSTPGHTVDHASLRVSTEPLRYSLRTQSGGRILGIGEVEVVVAGDAVVSPSCYLAGKVWDHNHDFYSREVGLASMRTIWEIADYIIPGHGGIFRNPGREEREE
jgi:glyoxylase-like metal-dependent hydrolase (beta-lactamase superfamily II)